MRPIVAAWLAAHGWPAWAAPSYAVMIGLGVLAGNAAVLSLARRQGFAKTLTGALLAAYLGALAGGDLFEALRVAPAALRAGSLEPFFHVGRAAYGALLGALGGLWWASWRLGIERAALFDFAAVGGGIVFGLARLGCFLAGCDYGVPAALPWAVRYPPQSFAAHDHFLRGYVPEGGASLPVHPTQVYESLLGFLSAAIAWWLLSRWPARDGRVFAAWLATYAVGRFVIELFRGDVDRGVYGPLSTAQIVSLVIVLALAAWITARSLAARRSAVAPGSLAHRSGAAASSARL